MKKIFKNLVILFIFLMLLTPNIVFASSVQDDNTASFTFFSIFVIVLSLLFVLIADGMWINQSRNSGIKARRQFYPPKNLNSAELSFHLFTKSTDKSIVSLLLHFASKGYLKVEENDKASNNNSKSFKVTKLKEYNGMNKNEKLFFDGLFSQENTVYLSNDNNSSVPTNFAKTINTIKKNLNSRVNLFEEIFLSKKKWLLLMILIILVLVNIEPVITQFSSISMLPLMIALPIIGYLIIIFSIHSVSSSTIKDR